MNLTPPETTTMMVRTACGHCTGDEFSAPYPQTLHLQLAPSMADDGEDDTDEDGTDEDGTDGGAGSYCSMDTEEMSSSPRTRFLNQLCGNIRMIYTISLSVTVVDYNGKKDTYLEKNDDDDDDVDDDDDCCWNSGMIIRVPS